MSLPTPPISQPLPYPPPASIPGAFEGPQWQNWFVRIWGILVSNKNQTSNNMVHIWFNM